MNTVPVLLRVGRWHVAVPIAVALLVVATWQDGSVIDVPLVDWPVAVPLVLALAGAWAAMLLGASALYVVRGPREARAG